jgi:hypothetical protein
MTTALEGGEWSAACPGRILPPGKTRYPLYRRLGGPQGQSGQVRKISPPPTFDPWTVQPVVSRYTDWATQPTINLCNYCKIIIVKCFFNKPRKLSMCLIVSKCWSSGLQTVQTPPTYITPREDLHVLRADQQQMQDLLFGTASLCAGHPISRGW